MRTPRGEPRERPGERACGIETLLLEHLRQRNLGTVLRTIADAPILDARTACIAAERLPAEHARHVADDEEVFFPLLTERLPEGDRLHRMLEDLRADHALIGELVAGAVRGLEASLDAEGPGLDSAARLAIRLLAERKHRHLTIENAILLPRALDILSAHDRETLAGRLVTRHSLDAAADRSPA